MSDRSPYSCGYEVDENGTARPLPIPAAIRSLADLPQRQAAEAAWEAASRLNRLMNQWRQWFILLRNDGDADPEFECCLRGAVRTCVETLRKLGFGEGPEDEILGLFPNPPSGTLIPPWQYDQRWLGQSSTRWGNLGPVQRRLSSLLDSLESAPGVVVGHPEVWRGLFSAGHDRTVTFSAWHDRTVTTRPTLAETTGQVKGPRTTVASGTEKPAIVPTGSLSPETEAGQTLPARDITAPVDQAAEQIGASRKSVDLIRYLSKRDGYKAHLDDIAVELAKAPKVTAHKRRRTMRQRFNRARDLLDEIGSPVRLTIEANVIRLVIPPTPPERATPV
jgi:hypothetical protein